jgi:hypothetical protein
LPAGISNLLILLGGEGGIRTLNALYRSVSYRFYVAKDAKFAMHSFHEKAQASQDAVAAFLFLQQAQFRVLV